MVAIKNVIFFINKQWLFCLIFFVAYLLLRSILLLESNHSILSFSIIVIELYIFSTFLIRSCSIIRDKKNTIYFRSFFINEKKIMIELMLLYLFIFVIYYLISLPFVINEFIANGTNYSSLYLADSNGSLINVSADIFFRCVFQIIVCYSTAYAVYFNHNAWRSLTNGIRFVAKTKILIFLILIFNISTKVASIFIKNTAMDLIIEQYILSLIFPFCILALFHYYETLKPEDNKSHKWKEGMPSRI